ncbi:MAG: prepilin-type N-terminal cleavage/methylation domain-containing protein [Desulfosoma sp.]
MKYHSKISGFTLVELLVVLAIVALSLTLVITTVGGGLGRKEERRFVMELGGLLRKARQHAVAGGLAVAVVFSEEDRRCWIEDFKDEGLSIPREVEVEALGALRADGMFYLFFYPDGASSGAELTVRRRGVVLGRIRVDPLTGLAMAVTTEAG